MFGDDFAGDHADDIGFGTVRRCAEILSRHLWRLHGITTDGGRYFAGVKGCFGGVHAPTESHLCITFFECAEAGDVGTLTRCDEPTIFETEGFGGGQGCCAVGCDGGCAPCDCCADQVIEVAMFTDIKRVSIIGAETHIGRGAFI